MGRRGAPSCRADRTAGGMTKKPPVFRSMRLGKPYVRPEAKRASASKRGYGRRWQATRSAYLEENPVCVECTAPATEVDHIRSLRRGGSNEWSNLQALCKKCHARKTVKVDGALRLQKNRSGL